MGCFEVSLGDTLGVGTPAQVRSLLDVLLKVVPASRLAGHFHDTYGQAVANTVTAFDLGLRVFDSSVSGLGGCPYSPGAKGNLASEDIIYAFETMGISTGVDLQKVVEVGDWISKQIGRENGSRAGTAIFSKLHNVQQKPPTQRLVSNDNTTWTLIDDVQEYQVFRSGHTIKLVLSRPQNGNALTANMLRSLAELFERLSDDESVSRIILTAKGKFFCTGMDLSASGATTGASAAEAKDLQFRGLLRLFEAIDNAPQTTIAVINGSAYGGGVGLAFCCDIRLALADARFTLTEVKLGLCPATISKYVAREWGFSFTREAMLTARPVTPTELHDRIGSIHGIAKDEAGLEALLDGYLNQLKKCAPAASAKSKELLRAAYMHAGGVQQAATIRDVYDWMIRPSDEAKYGTEQFRAGHREIDWDAFVTRKGRSKL
jgi:hydroxymethylglutaryl-CoA lyase